MQELNLEDNEITRLPDNLEIMIPNVIVLNLNGNEFKDYEHTVNALKKCEKLKGLFINLHEEE